MMRLQILGDPRLMAQLQEVWAFTFLFKIYFSDNFSSLRRNPSWQQRLNQILPALQNCSDTRVKGNTVRNWPSSARSSVLMQIPLMWRRKGRLKKLFDNNLSWRIWSMLLNILPKRLEGSRCYSESFHYYPLRRAKKINSKIQY